MRRVGSDKDLSGRLVVCSLFFIFIELEGLWKAGICYWLALLWFASLFFFPSVVFVLVILFAETVLG
jgi:hypothetical protein